MRGVRLVVRSLIADIVDTFNRANGPLTGLTEVGGRTWQIMGGSSTVPGISNKTLKAISGSGNQIAAVSHTGPDYDISYRIAAVRAPSMVPSAGLEITDINNHVLISHRFDVNTPEYVIYRRLSGVLNVALRTGVAPGVGDSVYLQVRGATKTLIVNGIQIGTVELAGWENKNLAGFVVNGADTDSAFDNFAIYER